MKYLLALVFAGMGWGQPTLDTVASLGSSSNASFTTSNYTMGSGSNGYLLLGLTQGNSCASTGASWNGTAMSLLYFSNAPCTVWYGLANPTSGSHTFNITSGGGTNINAFAISYVGAGAVNAHVVSNTTASGGSAWPYVLSVSTTVANTKLVEIATNASWVADSGGTVELNNGMTVIVDKTASGTGANSITVDAAYSGGASISGVVIALAPKWGSGPFTYTATASNGDGSACTITKIAGALPVLSYSCNSTLSGLSQSDTISQASTGTGYGSTTIGGGDVLCMIGTNATGSAVTINNIVTPADAATISCSVNTRNPPPSGPVTGNTLLSTQTVTWP